MTPTMTSRGRRRRRCARTRSRANELARELLAIGAFDVATETWARTGGRRRLSRLLDEAFELLGSGLDRTAKP
jgi:hypothetical protein